MNKHIVLINFSPFRVGSTFFTLAVTIERYVAVSRPLFVEKNRLKRVLILTASSISFAYNLPRYVFVILFSFFARGCEIDIIEMNCF